MPQVQLPIFPDGLRHITREVAFECREGKVYYFNGHLPVFVQEEGDLATLRMFSSQLVINGNAKQAEIARAFGVPLVTVKRYVKLYRQEGTRGFFIPPKRRERHKLTPALCAEAQALLRQGMEVPEIGRRLGILATTLHKAIGDGRLEREIKKRGIGVWRRSGYDQERTQCERQRSTHGLRGRAHSGEGGGRRGHA